MSNIAIIGDSTSVLGFNPLGIDTYSLETPIEIVERWADIQASQYAVIFVTEPVFSAGRALFDELEEQLTPAVLPIPSTSGSAGIGDSELRRLLEMAVGTSMSLE